MSNICPNIQCRKEFCFLSLLKKHLNNSYHCSKDILDIDLYILELKNNKKNEKNETKENITCEKCNITYTRQSSLNRHLNTSQCNKEKYEKKIKIGTLQKQIDELSK